MTAGGTIASAVLDGDARLVARLASRPLKPRKDNFVERPWGGMRLRGFKGFCPLPDQHVITGLGLGESFEIAACDADDEARAHPSRVRFEDGSELTLAALLARQAPALLGDDFAARYRNGFPLLPKLLDIKELLSVQGHPPGNTEAYIVIDADPGATIRVGFNRDLDAAAFAAELAMGRAWQQELVDLLGRDSSPRLGASGTGSPRPGAAGTTGSPRPGAPAYESPGHESSELYAPGRRETGFAVDQQRLQACMQSWLADRGAAVPEWYRALEELGGARGAGRAELERLLERLKSLYWRVLDVMNEIEVRAGDVIYNANPLRVAPAAAASAEVHALGNPEGREILLLEIRRPGVTFRAWDNVRFPLRPIDIDAAAGALSWKRTAPEEFRVEPVPVPGRPGAWRSVVAPLFEIEHLRPSAQGSVAVPAEPPHCLHAIAGSVELHSERGESLGTLEQGESALVPIGVGAYHVVGTASAEVIRVALPDARG